MLQSAPGQIYEGADAAAEAMPTCRVTAARVGLHPTWPRGPSFRECVCVRAVVVCVSGGGGIHRDGLEVAPDGKTLHPFL